MSNLKIDTFLNIILFISLISIISAYFIEYVLGYQPCNLCLIERIPYGLSIFLIFINFISKKYRKFLILLLIIIFVFSLIISSYHYGIEQGFFDESSICSTKTLEITSKEQLLKQLSEKIISCKDVTFRIFGFSLTTINILLNIFLIFILIKLFINYEKIRK